MILRSLQSFCQRQLLPVFVLAFVCLPFIVVAAPSLPSEPSSLNGSASWLGMLISLFGGIALFLYGIELMSGALQTVAGKRLKGWLASVTRNRVMGALSGAAVTSVIQSSSVTTVLVVGFVSAGLMTMTQSIGVIMGANVGTTITAQIVAFKVSKAALFFIATGFGFWFFGRQEKIKAYGLVVMGLGLIFFGMEIMSDSMSPLRSYDPFLAFMRDMNSPVLGIFAGALFTAVIQSSSATTGIVIVMASQGFLNLEAGIALALGANIGTCVKVVLVSIGKSVEAKRAAMVHILFNVIGVIIWLPLIPLLAALSRMISPETVELDVISRMAVDSPRQIANANTLFNVINTLLFLPFAMYFGKLTCWLLPKKKVEQKEIVVAKYLDRELLNSPALALARVRLEVSHMGQIVVGMIEHFSRVVGNRNKAEIKEVSKIDDQVDVLQEKILRFLGRIRKTQLSENQTREFMQLMAAIDHIEHVGDGVSVGLAGTSKKFIKYNVLASPETRADFMHLLTEMEKAFVYALKAVSSEDQKAAQQVLVMADDIENAITTILNRLANKLVDEGNRPMVFRLEMAFCEQVRHIYSLSRRLAILTLPDSISPDT
ncbi:Na/Pi cotransporter family protein [Litoribacillus peritrichatus]